MLKIAIDGLVHDHVRFYVDFLKNIDGGRVVCLYDENRPLLSDMAGLLGIDDEHLYTDRDEMYRKESFDACFVFSETYMHYEIVKRCCEKKVHIMMEKPIAITGEQAQQMVEMSQKAGIRMMVNYILGFRPNLFNMKKAIDSGEIGRLLSMRFVDGHKGPGSFCSDYFCSWLFDREKNGGGALSDFGCYGSVIAAWLMDVPKKVTAFTNNLRHKDLALEDNAVVILDYGDSIATLEATWAQQIDGSSIQIIGTEGGFISDKFGEERFLTKKGDGKWTQTTSHITPRGYTNPIPYFVDSINNGLPIEGIFSPQYSVKAAKIIDAARESSLKGCTVKIND